MGATRPAGEQGGRIQSSAGETAASVHPELMRDGRLIKVMPEWQFPAFDVSLLHLGGRTIPRPVRVFKEFAAQMVPSLIPTLPT